MKIKQPKNCEIDLRKCAECDHKCKEWLAFKDWKDDFDYECYKDNRMMEMSRLSRYD